MLILKLVYAYLDPSNTSGFDDSFSVIDVGSEGKKYVFPNYYHLVPNCRGLNHQGCGRFFKNHKMRGLAIIYGG